MNHLMKRSCFLLLTASLMLPASAGWAATAGINKSASISMPASPQLAAAQAANVKLSKDDAFSRAKSYVNIPDNLKLNNSTFRSADAWRPFPEWSFSWSEKNPKDEADPLFLNISVDANTGELTSYSRNGGKKQSSNGVAKLSRESAREMAERFLTQSSPKKADLVTLYDRDMTKPKPPLGGTVTYPFHFARMVDGVMFPDNGIDISVDETGTVTSFYLNWNDTVSFTKPDKVMDEKAALTAYKENMKAKLSYLLPWENREEDRQTPSLVYRNPFMQYLDPETGKLVNFTQANQSSEPEQVSTSQLASHHSGKPLSQDAAFSLAKKILPIDGYTLTNAYYNESSYRDNRPVWNLQLEKTSKSKEILAAYVEMDAATGDILSYSNGDRRLFKQEGSSKKQSADKLKKEAFRIVSKWSPTLASELYFTGSQTESFDRTEAERVTYQFQRYVHGIQAASGSANVLFNSETGEVVYYNAGAGTEKYGKSLPEHISEEEAIDAWMKEAELELAYVLEPTNEVDFKSQMPKGKRTAKLVYRMSVTPYEQPYVLDAATGNWILESSRKTFALHRETPTDIAGIEAEKALMLMYEYDAISIKDGKLQPEKSITRGEMIEMLIISLNQGRISPMRYESRAASFADVSQSSKYFASVENAVDLGLLDKSSQRLNPDETINRAELAELLVRALGYSKLAEHPNLFTTTLTDVPDGKARGSIAIVSELGIMPGQDNRFQPAKEVSRADAAIAFYRFLEKRTELQENQGFGRTYRD
ncbi:MAG: S-layer homology domain-containing protein [Clostridia bacterium]